MIRRDAGAVSIFLAVIGLALLMAAGLAVDGGRKVAALREASHVADNAARAAAQAVDPDTLRSGSEIRLLPEEAVAAATDYLASVGQTGQISVDGDRATVSVTLTAQPRLLPTGPMTVTATETAIAVTEEPAP
jgi:hypothetical protein